MSDNDKKTNNSDDELNIDFKSIKENTKKFFSNKKIFNQTTLIIFLIFIAMFSAIYFRAYTESLPITEDWAENTVVNYYKSQIMQQVNAEYPNLPVQNKNEMVDEQFNEIYIQQKDQIESETKKIATTYKESFQDESGQTYLLAIDPYVYYRRARNIINTGDICDEIKDNTCWNNHMYAPLGNPTKKDGHSLIMTAMYKFVSFFNPNISILSSIYMLSAIIVMLGVIPAFFIAKKYSGIVGGFVSSMIIALHPYLLGRTPAGFVDTDGYGITMGLFVIWFIVEAFHAKKYINKVILAILAGLSTFIFKNTWSGGWFFTFDIILGILILIAFYQIIRISIDLHRKKHKIHLHIFKSKSVHSTLLILITYLLFVIITVGTSAVMAALRAPTTNSGIQNAAHSNLWPNVYTTVAELNTQQLSSILSSLVSNSLGQFLIFIALLAIPLSLIKKYDLKSWIYIIFSTGIYLILTNKTIIKSINSTTYISLIGITLVVGVLINLFRERSNRSNILLPSILTVLFMGTIYASVRGIRFVLLGINPFALMVGVTSGILFVKISKELHKSFEIPKNVSKIIVLILIGILLVNYVLSAHTVAKNEIPQMNDEWYNSLNKINQEADEKAIITSWWDFGHWFKAIADRAVTFDGASQNTPMAHWVGKSLATNNEELSIGILRMLDCGSNTAFELINNELNEPAKTINILDEIIQKDKQDAKTTLLNYGFELSTVNKILDNTHCNPPEAYYVTSEDMVSKSGVWAHFGFWDFEKADLYMNGKKKDFDQFKEFASKYNYNEDTITKYYDQIKLFKNEREANTWISPWPGYVGTGTCVSIANKLSCNVNVNLGKQQDGFNLRLEKYIFNINTEEGTGIVGVYNNNNIKIGESNVTLPQFTTEVRGELKTYNSKGDIELGMIVIDNKAVIASTELVNSIFTKLFYFDGAYTKHYEKFSDLTSTTTRDRIIVWKVDWEGNQNTVNENSINSEETNEETSDIVIDLTSLNKTEDNINDSNTTAQ